MYKVQFINTQFPGKGFIEGYNTAREAKRVANAYNIYFLQDSKKHPVRCMYLGKNGVNYERGSNVARNS